jgi:hypothetical protein
MLNRWRGRPGNRLCGVARRAIPRDLRRPALAIQRHARAPWIRRRRRDRSSVDRGVRSLPDHAGGGYLRIGRQVSCGCYGNRLLVFGPVYQGRVPAASAPSSARTSCPPQSCALSVFATKHNVIRTCHLSSDVRPRAHESCLVGSQYRRFRLAAVASLVGGGSGPASLKRGCNARQSPLY